MKVALVIDNNIEFAPYIYTYCDLLKNKYNNIDVLLWNRGSIDYSQNINNFNVISIINQKDTKNKIKLLWSKYIFCNKVFNYINHRKYDRIIVFNEDILLLLKKMNNVILDNRDLKVIRNNSRVSKFILKRKLKNVVGVIHASDAFSDYYFNQYNYNNNYIFYNIPMELGGKLQENIKLNDNTNKSNLTIGFIGVIRYIDQLRMLINSTRNTNFNVKISGGGKDYFEIKEYSKDFNHVKVEGKFDSRDTLKKYEDIDVIYSLYNTLNENVKLALPNKLAYSILLQKPIIVSRGTYLQKVVEEYNIGYAVADGDEEDLKIQLQKVYSNYRKFDFNYARKVFCEKIEDQKRKLINIL